MPDVDDDLYLANRGLVLRLAYDITGSWNDAEDVAQQTWLRWQNAANVRHPRAYLARIATHLAFDVLTERARIGYPGPFLPEPVETGPGSDETVAVAAEIEVALMVVLGTLSPLERAAFLLHDVFAFSHIEIAGILNREPAAVRQLSSRARRRLAERPPEDRPETADPSEAVALTTHFLAAARQGDVEQLQRHLTDDVVYIGDGGGKRPNARRPVHGPDKVARLIVGLAQYFTPETELRPVVVNHRPAVALFEAGELDQVAWFILREGRVSAIYSVRNPDKLSHLSTQSTVFEGPELPE